MSPLLPGFAGEVFCMDALRLLRALPAASLDACISSPMCGTDGRCRYDWGPDPAGGDPLRHWAYHEPIYQECLRVLRPGGVLAWSQGEEFGPHFGAWFGPHEVWRLCRRSRWNERAGPQLWVVQTRERRPVPLPADKDGVVLVDRVATGHPYPKPVEEMAFVVEAVTAPGQIVLDCFAGLGSGLVAAERLGRRWIGCDLGHRYCQVALRRISEARRGLGGLRDGASTPQWLFDLLDEQVRALAGQGFRLDAAAEPWNAKCDDFFDMTTDALSQHWSGWPTVFCNPPYSRVISQFAAKAIEASERGSTVVLLIPNWPGYEWFQEVKRRGLVQDVIGPVAFQRGDGSRCVLNHGYKSTALVVATLGPAIPPGRNGEPIRKRAPVH